MDAEAPAEVAPVWEHVYEGFADGEKLWVFRHDDTLVIVVPTTSLSGHRRSRYLALGPDGAVRWEKTHGCPGEDGYPWFEVAGDRLLCILDTSITAVSLSDGGLAWQWAAPGEVSSTVHVAGDRVVVTEHERAAYVLDATTGRTLARYAAERAAAAVEVDGVPVAVLVQEPEARKALLQAQPIGDASESPELLTPEPLWTLPWRDLATNFAAADGWLTGHTGSEQLASIDATTGEIAWAGPKALWPWANAVDGAWLQPVATETGDGFARVDGETRYVGWTTTWDGAYTSRVVSDGEIVGLGHNGNWAAVRLEDGARLAEGTFPRMTMVQGTIPLGAGVAVVTTVVPKSEVYRVSWFPLGEAVPADAIEPPARPGWLAGGVGLRYRSVTHEGWDPATGTHRASSQKTGVAKVSVDPLAVAWERARPDGAPESPWLDPAALASLRAGGTAVIDGRTVTGRGRRYVELYAGPGARKPRSWAQVVHATSDDGVSYAIADWTETPLIVAIEAPDRLVYLTGVDTLPEGR